MSELLTVSQASQILQISESLIYELVGKGRLLCFRLGRGRGVIRFSFERHLQPFLESTEEEKRDTPRSSSKRITLKHLA